MPRRLPLPPNIAQAGRRAPDQSCNSFGPHSAGQYALMFKIRSIAARLILAILFAVAITVGILGAFSIVQQRSLTRLALEGRLKQQYDGVVAAIDYEGRAALAVSTLLAALPPVADAIAKG